MAKSLLVTVLKPWETEVCAAPLEAVLIHVALSSSWGPGGLELLLPVAVTTQSSDASLSWLFLLPASSSQSLIPVS